MSGKIHARVLLDALEKLNAKPFKETVWRTTWQGRDPLVGNSGGGRWDPLNSFEVLYASTQSNGSIAEVYYHLSQAPVFSSSTVLIHQLKVNIKKILHLDLKTLQKLGVADPTANRIDTVQTHAISSAAHFLEFHGLLVPSARWDCPNLVLFLDQIDINECITVGNNESINWPAWKEKNK